jgi:hypothetical protein
LVGVHRRQVDVVGDHDHGYRLLPFQGLHQVHQAQLVGEIQRCGRLVQEDDVRPLAQRPRNRSPLLFPAAELVELSIGEVLHPGRGHCPAGGLEIRCARNAQDVLVRGAPQQNGFLHCERKTHLQRLGDIGDRARQ